VRVTANAVDFVFVPTKKLAYQPGQYMEWTLPHSGADVRGNRRYFTLASSPTESDIRLGVKFHQPSSSYKRALLEMDDDTPIVATQVAGDFTLPKNPQRKLVFIAGGIGITPFRSMIKYLLDMNQKRDIVLLYAASSGQELAYKEVFEQARQQLGITVIYVLANADEVVADSRTRHGFVGTEMIQEIVPDYRERIFYISGSHRMVAAVQTNLSELSVARGHIKVDYFPGYVES
jgi:ferredoxin-NADP reductase